MKKNLLTPVFFRPPCLRDILIFKPCVHNVIQLLFECEKFSQGTQEPLNFFFANISFPKPVLKCSLTTFWFNLCFQKIQRLIFSNLLMHHLYLVQVHVFGTRVGFLCWTYCWRTRVFFNSTFQFFEEIYLKKKKNSVILPVYSLFCDISNATDMYFSAKIFTLAL